jgi:hypothetical protein
MTRKAINWGVIYARISKEIPHANIFFKKPEKRENPATHANSTGLSNFS